jgi:hypothetical protein
MESIVELEIAAPRRKVAELFADLGKSVEWMDDLERFEPIRGAPGAPGSQGRLVPKKGDAFVATVLSSDLPSVLKLELDAPTVSVCVTGELVPLAPDRTRLVSRESFHFKGALSKLVGLLARRAIRNAHRRHMQAFKRFAERGSSVAPTDSVPSAR